MGYAVGSACYASKAEAEDVTFSSAQPLITSTGYVAFVKEHAGWRLNSYTQKNGVFVKVTSTPASITQVDCSLVSRFQDGLTLGWLSITPALAVMALLFIKRILPT